MHTTRVAPHPCAAARTSRARVTRRGRASRALRARVTRRTCVAAASRAHVTRRTCQAAQLPAHASRGERVRSCGFMHARAWQRIAAEVGPSRMAYKGTACGAASTGPSAEDGIHGHCLLHPASLVPLGHLSDRIVLVSSHPLARPRAGFTWMKRYVAEVVGIGPERRGCISSSEHRVTRASAVGVSANLGEVQGDPQRFVQIQHRGSQRLAEICRAWPSFAEVC